MKLPQLTLRDLFWLVALVAMGCGWWVETSEKQKLKEMIELQRQDHDLAERRMEMLLRSLGEQGMQVTFSGGHGGSNLSMKTNYEQSITERRMRRLLESAIRDFGYDIQWTDDSLTLTKGEDSVVVDFLRRMSPLASPAK